MAIGRGKRFTNIQFEVAIPGSRGIIATIARRVGCSWYTARDRIDSTPRLLQMFEDECNSVDDLAESVVINAMEEGDIGAAKWWLERRRRGRYATRIETEVSGKDGEPIPFRMVDYRAGFTETER